MTQHLMKLFMSSLLSFFVFGQVLLASSELSNINSISINLSTILDNVPTQNSQPTKKGILLRLSNWINPTKKPCASLQPFLDNGNLVCESFKFFDYVQLCKVAGTCKSFSQGAKAAQMPVGNAWADWINKMVDAGVPIEKFIAEIAAALTRSPNPLPALETIGGHYFEHVPANERLMEKSSNTHWDPELLKLTKELTDVLKEQDIYIKYSGKRELIKSSVLTKGERIEAQKQELLAKLLPYLRRIYPYAIATVMRGLLANNQKIKLVDNIPVTPVLAKDWIMANQTPQMLGEFLRYMGATHKILPVIKDCLEKQGKHAKLTAAEKQAIQADKTVIETTINGAPARYVKAAEALKVFPFGPALFDVEDQVVALYKQRIALSAQNQSALQALPSAFVSLGLTRRRVMAPNNEAELALTTFLDERYTLLKQACEEKHDNILQARLAKLNDEINAVKPL